jgi:hypothetical protein
MVGRIKGNGVALGMRCDELSQELVLTDAETLAEIKDKLEKLEHLVENIAFDLDLREEGGTRIEE